MIDYEHIAECAGSIVEDSKKLISIFGIKSKKPSWIESVIFIQSPADLYVGWYSFNSMVGDLFAVILFGDQETPRKALEELRTAIRTDVLLTQFLELRATSQIPWPVLFRECTLEPGFKFNFDDRESKEFITESSDIKEIENTLVNYERWFTKD